MALPSTTVWDWRKVRDSEISSLQKVRHTRLLAAPFCKESELEQVLFSDLYAVPIDQQENLLLEAVQVFLQGWNAENVQVVSEHELCIEVNPSFSPVIRSMIDNCKPALLNVYNIYQNTYDAVSNPLGPTFPFILADELINFVNNEVASKVCDIEDVSELIYFVTSLGPTLHVCEQMSELLKQPFAMPNYLMDSLGVELENCVDHSARQIVAQVLRRMREKWSLLALAWVINGECLRDTYFEFMIWELAHMRTSHNLNILKVSLQESEGGVLIDNKFVAMSELCPQVFRSDYEAIVSAGKYTRLMVAARIKLVPFSVYLPASDLENDVLTSRAIRKVCRARSEQLLRHIHDKFDLKYTFEVVNGVFLGTQLNLGSLLEKVCGDNLYRPCQDVPVHKLRQRYGQQIEVFGEALSVLKDTKLEYASDTFFGTIGIQSDHSDLPTVVSTLMLSWAPNALLREIWSESILYSLSMLQRYMFMLHALLLRVEETVLQIARQVRNRTRLSSDTGKLHQLRVATIHQFLLRLLSWTRDMISAEAIQCEERLSRALNVEDMCRLLQDELIAPIIQKSHICAVDMIGHLQVLCDSIFNIISDSIEPEIDVFYSLFLESRDALMIHMKE